MDRISSRGKSCTIVCALLLQEQLDKSVTSHTLEDLQPYQEYSFRIVAHNGNGPGMSTEEVVTRTLSDTPSGVPQNFTLEAASSLVRMFNPDMPNGISHPYQMNKSIPNSRVAG